MKLSNTAEEWSFFKRCISDQKRNEIFTPVFAKQSRGGRRPIK